MENGGKIFINKFLNVLAFNLWRLFDVSIDYHKSDATIIKKMTPVMLGKIRYYNEHGQRIESKATAGDQLLVFQAECGKRGGWHMETDTEARRGWQLNDSFWSTWNRTRGQKMRGALQTVTQGGSEEKRGLKRRKRGKDIRRICTSWQWQQLMTKNLLSRIQQ